MASPQPITLFCTTVLTYFKGDDVSLYTKWQLVIRRHITTIHLSQQIYTQHADLSMLAIPAAEVYQEYTRQLLNQKPQLHLASASNSITAECIPDDPQQLGKVTNL